jgi:hypothetical protein
MTIDQLKSLTEDELSMLWFCINKVNPQILKEVELEPVLFTSINHKKLMNRLNQCKVHVKAEHQQVYDGLMNKLTVR